MEHLFNSMVDVKRITKTKDDYGSWTETFELIHDNLKCRINWTKGEEHIMFGKETHIVDAKIYCNVVDIKVTDRVTYKEKDYEVIDVQNPDEVNKYLIVKLHRAA